MKKLLKQYGFNSDMQYFQMIVDECRKVSIEQGVMLFKDLPKQNKSAMLKSICVGGWETGLSKQTIALMFDAI